MVLDFLFKRQRREETCRYLAGGKLVEKASPLPGLLPGLYKQEAKDGLRSLEAHVGLLESTVGDALHLLRLPQKLRSPFVHNCRQVLQISPIYMMHQSLARRGLERFVINSHRLATLLQACAGYGESDMAPALQELLMPALFGIYARYYGVPYLKDDELKAATQMRKFDMADPKQRERREEFLDSYRREMARLAEVSEDRLLSGVGRIKRDSDAVRTLLHVIRYSNRLMGRTALEMSRDQEKDIHEIAAYVGVLYSICSAQAASGKRFCVILAEEYQRADTHRRHQGMEKSARYNVHALTDLMQACRCHVLKFFQGSKNHAFYSETERLYVRNVAAPDAYPQWRCFRSEKAPMAVQEREKRCPSTRQRRRFDPKDSELTEVPIEQEEAGR